MRCRADMGTFQVGTRVTLNQCPQDEVRVGFKSALAPLEMGSKGYLSPVHMILITRKTLRPKEIEREHLLRAVLLDCSRKLRISLSKRPRMFLGFVS